MNGHSYLDFRNELNRRGIVFTYCGFLNDDILTGIGDALRTKLALDQTDAKTSRGIFSAFVEQVQNVIRYSAEKEGPLHQGEDLSGPEISYGLLSIGNREDGRKFVACCNMIRTESAPALHSMLGRIKGLDRKELTRLMREQLKEGPPEGSRGAGVGFISIAREANGEWDYEIVATGDSSLSFFCFEAYF